MGIVDNKGKEIFADKAGLLIARNLSNHHKNKKIIIDVKSTSLFSTDEILQKIIQKLSSGRQVIVTLNAKPMKQMQLRDSKGPVISFLIAL